MLSPEDYPATPYKVCSDASELHRTLFILAQGDGLSAQGEVRKSSQTQWTLDQRNAQLDITLDSNLLTAPTSLDLAPIVMASVDLHKADGRDGQYCVTSWIDGTLVAMNVEANPESELSVDDLYQIAEADSPLQLHQFIRNAIRVARRRKISQQVWIEGDKSSMEATEVIEMEFDEPCQIKRFVNLASQTPHDLSFSAQFDTQSRKSTQLVTAIFNETLDGPNRRTVRAGSSSNTSTITSRQLEIVRKRAYELMGIGEIIQLKRRQRA